MNDRKGTDSDPNEFSVSVVVPTSDRPLQLQRLLTSLDGLVGCVPLEIVVVDDSTNGMAGPLLDTWASAPHMFAAKVLKQAPPHGPGKARNQGARLATAEIVAFTDDDCVVHPRWLESLIRRVDRRRGIVGAGGRVSPIHWDWVSKYYTFRKILEPPPSNLYLVTANCCYLRRPLLDVGGFDEDIRHPGGEDIAASLNLAQAGWTFDFAEDAIVFHDYRSNLFDFVRTFRNYGKGCRVVTEKRHGLLPGAVPSDGKFKLSPTVGGYGEGYGGGYGALKPPALSPESLARDFLSDLADCRAARLPVHTAAWFPLLGLLQRLAYSAGWQDGLTN